MRKQAVAPVQEYSPARHDSGESEVADADEADGSARMFSAGTALQALLMYACRRHDSVIAGIIMKSSG